MSNINYLVLARRYRPKVLSDFKGQDEVCTIIKSAILNNRLAHAYLFSGTRGVGKTTLARLIAKIVNCLSRKSSEIEPCNNCENCNSISKEKNIDVVEIDAASKTGVSDVREIIENINYKPVSAIKKIYIIDEVHMLSKAAFNALLKTLEEPPTDVLFLLATTETEKIPITILSRCQHLQLKRISPEVIMNQIITISKVEGFELPNDSAILIARCAEGSMRDALSILDNILIHKNKIDKQAVQSILRIEDFSNVIILFENVCQGNIEETLNLVDEFYNAGKSFENIAKELLNIIFQVSKYKVVKNFDNSFISEKEKKHYSDLANKLDMDVLIRFWELMQKYFRELIQSIDQKQYFEMSMIRLCYLSIIPTPFEALHENKNNTEQIEESDEPNSFSLLTNKNLALKPEKISTGVSKEDEENTFKNQIKIFTKLINQVESNGDLIISHKIKNDFRLVSLKYLKDNKKNFGEIELENYKNSKLENNQLWKLSKKIEEITNKRWLITLSSKKGYSSIAENDEKNKVIEIKKIAKIPAIKKLLEIIPDSKVISIEKLDKRKKNE